MYNLFNNLILVAVGLAVVYTGVADFTVGCSVGVEWATGLCVGILGLVGGWAVCQA